MLTTTWSRSYCAPPVKTNFKECRLSPKYKTRTLGFGATLIRNGVDSFSSPQGTEKTNSLSSLPALGINFETREPACSSPPLQQFSQDGTGRKHCTTVGCSSFKTVTSHTWLCSFPSTAVQLSLCSKDNVYMIKSVLPLTDTMSTTMPGTRSDTHLPFIIIWYFDQMHRKSPYTEHHPTFSCFHWQMNVPEWKIQPFLTGG